MTGEEETPTGAMNEAGACAFCGRTPSEVGYTYNMVDGTTVCPQCRTYTNYNGDQ